MTEFERLIYLFNNYRARFHTLATTHVTSGNEFVQQRHDEMRAQAYHQMNQVAIKLERDFADELAAYRAANPGWPYSDLPAPPKPAPEPVQRHLSPVRTWAGVPDLSTRIKPPK